MGTSSWLDYNGVVLFFGFRFKSPCDFKTCLQNYEESIYIYGLSNFYPYLI